jgi:hypothetical protein
MVPAARVTEQKETDAANDDEREERPNKLANGDTVDER